MSRWRVSYAGFPSSKMRPYMTFAGEKYECYAIIEAPSRGVASIKARACDWLTGPFWVLREYRTGWHPDVSGVWPMRETK